MAVYEYVALDGKGKRRSGTVEAGTPRDARLSLRAAGVYPAEILERVSSETIPSFRKFVKPVSRQDLALFARQVTTLLEAGLPLVHALSGVNEQTENRALKAVVSEVTEKVREGKSFSEALSSYDGIFPPVFINMVRAGESGGSLEAVLSKVSELMEKQVAIRNRVRSIFAYPVLVFLVGMIVAAFLLTVVIPQLTAVFLDFSETLPLPTRMLVFLGDMLVRFWWLAGMVLGLLMMVISSFSRTEKGRLLFDRIKIRLPVLGKIFVKASVSRFSRTLGTLAASGVPILSCLDIARNVVGNQVLSNALVRVRQNVKEGESITAPLRKEGVFPPLAIRLMSVGEESGRFEEMLEKIADTYDGEVETSVNTLSSLLEPAMIILMGLFVGFIVLAIVLPIFEINQVMVR